MVTAQNTSLTAVQTEMEQSCHIHAYTSGINGMVSALRFQVRVQHSPLGLVPIPDTGIDGVGVN